MELRRPERANRGGVRRRDVTDVRDEAVVRVERVESPHDAVANDLRHDRRRRDRGAAASPSTIARCGGAAGPSRKPSTRQASAGGCRSLETARRPARFERCSPLRSISPAGTNRTLIADAHADDRMEELLALRVRELLRVVQRRQRPNARAAQQLVVEKDSGDDERACERAATGLVRSRDEAHAELAIDAEEALAGWIEPRGRG